MSSVRLHQWLVQDLTAMGVGCTRPQRSNLAGLSQALAFCPNCPPDQRSAELTPALAWRTTASRSRICWALVCQMRTRASALSRAHHALTGDEDHDRQTAESQTYAATLVWPNGPRFACSHHCESQSLSLPSAQAYYSLPNHVREPILERREAKPLAFCL